ncbi:EF-hand domain-containing protein [Actinomadura sp. 6N118]|uniref:EF-hand domain-containing protein n=1 Tax=Actinomadura sp. 6N118 TaxID=3375151 RepID=UPI0037AEB443
MTTNPTEDELFTAFTRADLGGDEKLDLMEFTMVLESLGLSWARHEVQDRFEKTDTNHDGFISFPELRTLFETLGLTGPQRA